MQRESGITCKFCSDYSIGLRVLGELCRSRLSDSGEAGKAHQRAQEGLENSFFKMENVIPRLGPGVTGGRPQGEEGVVVFLLGPLRIQPQNSTKRRYAALQKGAPSVF